MEAGQLVPNFWLLFRQAYESAEAVDNFDLRSESNASREMFARLKQEQVVDAEALIRFVQTEGDRIVQILKEPTK